MHILEEEFKNYLGIKHAVAFNSGRSALMAILKSLNFQKGDEILVQAFTCNAVPNPILWVGLKPVYVDCGEDFNIDIQDLRKKISPKSRAVIVQHTFGFPALMDEILEICRLHNLIVIEDCAHSLGAEYRRKKVGTFGKAAFFSFSRDKVISSVYGGIAVTNDDGLAEKLREYQQKIGNPPRRWTIRQLLHPILMNTVILPTYSLFGKYVLIAFQVLGILSKAVDWKEKRGKKPSYFPKRMPESLAVLAAHQLRKLNRFNDHRRKMAQFYFEQLQNTDFLLPKLSPDTSPIFLRFPIRHPKAHEIMKECWKNNVLIGDWYTVPIAPHDTKLAILQYREGSCPTAEKLAKETLNLPTQITISQEEAQKIAHWLLQIVKYQL